MEIIPRISSVTHLLCQNSFFLSFILRFTFSRISHTLYSQNTSMIYKNHQNGHRPAGSALTLVIKIGTTSICDEKTHFPLLSNLSGIVEAVLKLKSQGHRVVLVTSAAVGTGLRRLNMPNRPEKMAALQVTERCRLLGNRQLISFFDYPGSGCRRTGPFDTSL